MTKNELLDLFDRFAARAELLEERQQSLVRLFQSVQNFRTIAATAKVDEVTIARKLKRIAQRISSDKFIAALSNITPTTGVGAKQILKEKFINGKSIREIANETGLSFYEVKKIINRIERRTSNVEHSTLNVGSSRRFL
jgi:DNA invertase Pin-like site-specific DNA recombinase